MSDVYVDESGTGDVVRNGNGHHRGGEGRPTGTARQAFEAPPARTRWAGDVIGESDTFARVKSVDARREDSRAGSGGSGSTGKAPVGDGECDAPADAAHPEAASHGSPGDSAAPGAISGGAGTGESAGEEDDARLARMGAAVRTLLEAIGDDPDREGLVDTPTRVAKALLYLTRGTRVDSGEAVGRIVRRALFDEGGDDAVLVRGIALHSLCEHHMLPFSGTVSIAYVPNGRVVGLSKLARIVDVFARQLQVQERLTRQVATAVSKALNARGVAVRVDASHMCMAMRGVERVGSTTTTTCFLGCYKTDPALRAEFLSTAG